MADTKAGFRFKQFELQQDRCAMKVGTDGVLLGAWANTQDTTHALDIGTGTGLIALMLAQRAPELRVDAVEIDEASSEQARYNIAASPWASRMQVFCQPVQDYARSAQQPYDLIVSNPPFFTGGNFNSGENRLSVRHTVKLPHGDLLIAVRQLLAEQGRFCVILPYLEGLRFQERAEAYHLYCTRITEVTPVPGKPVERLLMQFEPTPKGQVTDQLLLRNRGGGEDYTEAYRALTKEFYLNF